MKILSCAVLSLFLVSCNQNEEKSNPQGKWIVGTAKAQLEAIEKQFRGFDNAMVETGYRYQELYWAGQDENWEYAEYQLGKLKVAIENGLERRPKRAASAEHFLNEVLPQMQQAIQRADTTHFNKNFLVLTSNCNSCHAKERVPFFTVQTPTMRLSPIKK